MFPPMPRGLLLLMRDRGLTSETRLDQAYDEWRETNDDDDDAFVTMVEVVTGRTAIVQSGYAYWAIMCENCVETSIETESNRVFDSWYCESCTRDLFAVCYSCGSWTYSDEASYIHDSHYCESCAEEIFEYCEECEEYERRSSNHSHGCDCEAPHQTFRFPANGSGTIGQDERLTVQLPKGTVDDQGVAKIKEALYAMSGKWTTTVDVVESVGPEWQTKRGNLTRRLSSAWHKAGLGKIDAQTLSKIGNIARAHSSDDAWWHVEMTRDLNQSAEAFYHEDSCWWQSYYASRCALKQWGGIGMRSYTSDTACSHDPSGRVWVQPLNEDLLPTHESARAHAYVIYNGYGDLGGYIPARIVAHLAGMTYRKIGFSASPQYVNNNAAYLVAPEDVCSMTEQLDYCYGEHDKRDADTFDASAANNNGDEVAA